MSGPIGEVVDNLGEKRGKTREGALRDLAAVLRQYHPAHDTALAQYEETLPGLLMQCARRGAGKKEGELAAEALAVLFVATSDGDDLWRRAGPALRKLASRCGAPGDDAAAAARAAVVRAAAMGCFVLSQSPEETYTLLSLFGKIAVGAMGDAGADDDIPAPAPVRAAALEGWSLLATTLPDDGSRVSGGRLLLPAILSALRGGGESGGSSEDADWRVAAATVAALVHESLTAHKETLEENGESYFPEPGDDDLWMAIREAVHERATVSHKRMSKAAKKEQHAAFRGFLRALDANEAPDTRLAFASGHVEVTNWVQHVHLLSFRRVLQGGLPAHLHGNDIMAAIFAEVMERDDELVADDDHHRSKSSAAGRARTRQRGKERAQRQTDKDRFLDADQCDPDDI